MDDTKGCIGASIVGDAEGCMGGVCTIGIGVRTAGDGGSTVGIGGRTVGDAEAN